MFINRNARYNDAYGDYRGGYGPGGGFGPPRGGFHPRPPPLMGWNAGFGPSGPPMRRQAVDDRTIRYLLRKYFSKLFIRLVNMMLAPVIHRIKTKNV